MPRRFPLATVGLALWAVTMALLVGLPSHVWHYPNDLWLRVLVTLPALAGMVLLLIARFKGA